MITGAKPNRLDTVSRNGQRVEVAPPNSKDYMSDKTIIEILNAENRIWVLLKLPPLIHPGAIKERWNLKNVAKQQ